MKSALVLASLALFALASVAQVPAAKKPGIAAHPLPAAPAQAAPSPQPPAPPAASQDNPCTAATAALPAIVENADRAAYLAIYLQAARAQKCIALVSGQTERLTAENAQLKAAAKAGDLEKWGSQIDQSVSTAQAALSAELEKASKAAAEKAKAAAPDAAGKPKPAAK